MNGQTRARLTALVGTVALLLTGITFVTVKDTRKPGAEQAIEIAATLNVTQDIKSSDGLGNAFHNDARQATLITEKMVAADLAKALKRQSAVVMAKATFSDTDRG
jgi:hypothetical protein